MNYMKPISSSTSLISAIPTLEEHITAVEKILEELDISIKPTILVFNKADRYPDKLCWHSLRRAIMPWQISALDKQHCRVDENNGSES